MENTRRKEHSMESKQCDYEIPNEYGEPTAKFFLFKVDKKNLPTRSYVYKRKAIAEARTQAQQAANPQDMSFYVARMAAARFEPWE
jgi:hypothetical protein